MKATKKPVTIDFISYEGSVSGVMKWVKEMNEDFNEHFIFSGVDLTLRVKTLEGTSYVVTESDVIIRGIKGEYYPCKKDIFEQTHNVI